MKLLFYMLAVCKILSEHEQTERTRMIYIATVETCFTEKTSLLENLFTNVKSPTSDRRSWSTLCVINEL